MLLMMVVVGLLPLPMLRAMVVVASRPAAKQDKALARETPMSSACLGWVGSTGGQWLVRWMVCVRMSERIKTLNNKKCSSPRESELRGARGVQFDHPIDRPMQPRRDAGNRPSKSETAGSCCGLEARGRVAGKCPHHKQPNYQYVESTPRLLPLLWWVVRLKAVRLAERLLLDLHDGCTCHSWGHWGRSIAMMDPHIDGMPHPPSIEMHRSSLAAERATQSNPHTQPQDALAAAAAQLAGAASSCRAHVKKARRREIMAILYSLVARGKVVLAEFTSTSGNFPTVVRFMLSVRFFLRFCLLLLLLLLVVPPQSKGHSFGQPPLDAMPHNPPHDTARHCRRSRWTCRTGSACPSSTTSKYVPRSTVVVDERCSCAVRPAPLDVSNRLEAGDAPCLSDSSPHPSIHPLRPSVRPSVQARVPLPGGGRPHLPLHGRGGRQGR